MAEDCLAVERERYSGGLFSSGKRTIQRRTVRQSKENDTAKDRTAELSKWG